MRVVGYVRLLHTCCCLCLLCVVLMNVTIDFVLMFQFFTYWCPFSYGSWWESAVSCKWLNKKKSSRIFFSLMAKAGNPAKKKDFLRELCFGRNLMATSSAVDRRVLEDHAPTISANVRDMNVQAIHDIFSTVYFTRSHSLIFGDDHHTDRGWEMPPE